MLLCKSLHAASLSGSCTCSLPYCSSLHWPCITIIRETGQFFITFLSAGHSMWSKVWGTRKRSLRNGWCSSLRLFSLCFYIFFRFLFVSLQTLCIVGKITCAESSGSITDMCLFSSWSRLLCNRICLKVEREWRFGKAMENKRNEKWERKERERKLER